MPVKSDHF